MTLIMKATEFDAQSAGFKKRYKDVQDLADRGWLVQPKYDGCFGMAVLQEDLADCRMLSRTGEDYSASCGHILATLHGLIGRAAGDVVLGEVWHKTWEFPKISGSMRRRAACPELVFMVHDLLPLTLETDLPYSMRLEQLRMLVPNFATAGSSVALVGSLPRTNVQNIAIQLKERGGYDGAILKDPIAPYKIGNVRNGEIVKVKPTMSLDLRCVGAAVEAGEKTGRPVLRIVVKHGEHMTWVGSGVTHDLKPEDVIQKIIEIEFMGYTPDGLLREPRFKGIRFDKTQPDA